MSTLSGVFGLMAKTDLLAVRLHVLDRGKHILRFVRLDVKHDQVRTGIAKRSHVAVRPVDHEMHIQKHLRMLAHRFHNRNAD